MQTDLVSILPQEKKLWEKNQNSNVLCFKDGKINNMKSKKSKFSQTFDYNLCFVPYLKRYPHKPQK